MRSFLIAVLACSSLANVACSKSDTKAAGNGGTTSAAHGHGNGGGGTTSSVTPDAGPVAGGENCSSAAGANDTNLTVYRPEIGAHVLGALAGALVVRIARDPLTGGVYYMNQDGQFWLLNLATGESTAVDMGVSGHDFRGMTFGPDGTLYVLGNEGTLGVETSVLIQKGTLGDAGTRTWTTIATSDRYPAGSSDLNHRFGGLTISPDGQWLYFGSGSRTDHGEKQGSQREVPLTSAIFRVPVDAHDLMLQNDATVLQPYLYADGFRNPFEMEFNGEAELFAIDNGPDIDLPDEINWVREGNSYGFPWRFGAEANPVLQSDYRGTGDQRLHAGYQAFDLGTYKYDSTFPAAPANVQLVDPILNHGPDGDHFRSGPDSDVLDASQMGQTLAGVTAHRSPLGLAFDTAGSLCGEYKGAGFALSFGAVQDVMGDPGGDLLMLQMSKVNGAYEMHATQLVAGFLGPVDSLLLGNKLYVIEFTGDAGNIYEISLPETVAPTFR